MVHPWFACSGKEGEGAGHERKEKDRDREANVSAAAIEALGAVAGSLGWSHYRELLNLFMRVMQKNDSKVWCIAELRRSLKFCCSSAGCTLARCLFITSCL